jgi:hypothetical protein
MNIDDYTPDNFHPDKWHALKCLWLFRRHQELFAYYMQQISDRTPEAFFKVNPVHSAREHLQRETGLCDDDIHHYNLVGGYIHEYSQILEMTPQELEEHIDSYESDPVPLDPEDQASLDEMLNNLFSKLQQNNQMREQFGQIIDDNFND